MSSTNSEIRKQGRQAQSFLQFPLSLLCDARGDSYAGIKRSTGWHFACMSQLPSSPIPFPSITLKVTCLRQSCVIHIQHILMTLAASLHMTGALLRSLRPPAQTIPYFLVPKNKLCTGQQGQKRTATSKTQVSGRKPRQAFLRFSAYLASTPKLNMTARKDCNTLV